MTTAGKVASDQEGIGNIYQNAGVNVVHLRLLSKTHVDASELAVV